MPWPFSQAEMRRFCLDHLRNIHGDRLSARYPTVRDLAYKLWEYRRRHAEHGIPVVADHDNALADWYAAERALRLGKEDAAPPATRLTPAEAYMLDLLQSQAEPLFRAAPAIAAETGRVWSQVRISGARGDLHRASHYVPP